MFTMVDVLDLEIGTVSSSLKHLLRLICDGGIGTKIVFSHNIMYNNILAF